MLRSNSLLRWSGLIATLATIAGLWLVAAPKLANTPAFLERAVEVRQAGIDPTAVFYTELPSWEEQRFGEAPERRD